MPRTRIAPTTATRKLCRLKPLMEPPMPNMVASQPPTTAPTIPRIQAKNNPGNNSHVQALVSMNRTQEMLTSTL